jgi:RNA polymerase sigma-70 factor (ECF subfamily)
MDISQQLALVADFKAGNKEAYGLLYDEYIKPIYKFIYYKTHHKETAEDITSQVFMKAYNAIHSFNETKGTFSAWLYQIARNTIIDHYRAVKPTQNIDDVWNLSSSENVARDVETRLELEKVQNYLRVLPSEQRDIIIMRVWQEMSYSEIATVLGTSEAGCKMQFSRSIKKLRETMPMELLLLLLLPNLINRLL